VVGLTKSASIEYARDGITINAVAPGPVKTEIIQHFVEDGSYTKESIASILPMKRMGVPSDIARAVSFLLNSPFATGTILSVDGGFAV
jgi:NAD(P)-dependent dehydrogenase (short-subunit alcohol dehydrogenase family)